MTNRKYDDSKICRDCVRMNGARIALRERMLLGEVERNGRKLITLFPISKLDSTWKTKDIESAFTEDVTKFDTMFQDEDTRDLTLITMWVCVAVRRERGARAVLDGTACPHILEKTLLEGEST